MFTAVSQLGQRHASLFILNTASCTQPLNCIELFDFFDQYVYNQWNNYFPWFRVCIFINIAYDIAYSLYYLFK